MKIFNKPLNNKVNEKISFFSGENLINFLKTSTFGLFNETIANLGIPTDNFKLPSIIIIGTESTGKSSLIQNILKCPIFPIDSNICTKVPIKLELINSQEEKFIITFQNNTTNITNKEEILPYITNIMIGLKDEILEDELNIKFYHPNVINYTFYDLPGIREFPENLRLKSKNITNKYINNPNTLIICVVPATTTRITSNQALGMVIDNNKCNDCIIALSMIDNLKDYQYDDLLLNRILNNNDELKNINIHKIIGVINSKDKNFNELEWFNNNIIQYIDNELVKEEILKHITLNQLLIQLDNKYHNFIRDNWKNQGLEEITKHINKLNKDYENLGNENENLIDIINYIKTQLKLFEFLKITKPEFYNYYNINISFNLNYYKSCDKDIDLLDDYYNNIKSNLINIPEQIDIIFKNDSIYKLVRFEKLKQILKDLIKDIINSNYKEIDEWYNKITEDLKYNLENIHQLCKILNILLLNITRYIINDLENIEINEIYDFYIEINNRQQIYEFNEDTISNSSNNTLNESILSELLEESESYINYRIYIKSEINKYIKSKNTISNIENYIKKEITNCKEVLTNNIKKEITNCKEIIKNNIKEEINNYKDIFTNNIKKEMTKKIGLNLTNILLQ